MLIELPARMTRGEIASRTSELVLNLRAEFWTDRRPVQPPASRVHSDRPSDAAFRLLEIAGEDWFRTLTKVYEAAKFRPDDGELLCTELTAAGYVTIHPVKTFRQGGQIKLLLPTPLGISKLKDANVDPAPVRGDAPHGPTGDATHIFYQNLILKKLRKQGWTAEIEMTRPRKRVDVGAIRGSVTRAYEVVNEGLDKELSNLTQDVEDGWQEVMFCVGNEQIKTELMSLIEARLGTRLPERCTFALLPSFR